MSGSWLGKNSITKKSCHSEPGAKPGESLTRACRGEPAFRLQRSASVAPFLACFGRKPALSLSKGGALVAALSLMVCSVAGAQSPQDLLATGRVDQAIQTFEQ